MRKGLILFGLAMLPATALGAVESAVHADQREGTMENSAEHNIAVVKQMIAAWEERDADAIAEIGRLKLVNPEPGQIARGGDNLFHPFVQWSAFVARPSGCVATRRNVPPQRANGA